MGSVLAGTVPTCPSPLRTQPAPILEGSQLHNPKACQPESSLQFRNVPAPCFPDFYGLTIISKRWCLSIDKYASNIVCVCVCVEEKK